MGWSGEGGDVGPDGCLVQRDQQSCRLGLSREKKSVAQDGQVERNNQKKKKILQMLQKTLEN